ncbi:MAG: hypothetical protein ACRDYZ_12630 [Acidimicrobiales bacterium]
MKELVATSFAPNDHDHNVDAWPWVLDPSLQTYRARPLIDADAALVLAQGVSELASTRCPALGIAGPLADLHATVSLLRQGRAFIPDVLADARLQDRSWTEIAAQLEVSLCRSVSIPTAVTGC